MNHHMRRLSKIVLVLGVLGIARVVCAAGDYAVVVSKATADSADWKKVVDALLEKHQARLIVYSGKVDEGIAQLKDPLPRFACFVATPEEAGRDFVITIHRETRKLDEDPYTDVVWGIVTGYSAGDALRIAAAKEPLVIRKGAAGTGIDLNLFDEGRWYSEGAAGEYWVKPKGEAPQKNKGPQDSTNALVSTFNDYQPDFWMTSGHATERDWQPGYSYKNGQFRCAEGKLFGLDLKGKKHPIESQNPKIFLGAGNCLIGHIPDRNAMALAYLGSGGVNQMTGYTVVTWYGAMGWGVKDFLFELPGRHNHAEAFFFSNQAIVQKLETRFAGKPREVFNKWDMEKDRSIMGGAAQALGYKGDDKNLKDHLGLLWDVDTVAFYGDPAWDARLAPRSLPVETELTEKNGEWTFTVRASKDVKLGKPLAQLLPRRMKNPALLEGEAFAPVITDNFLMLPSNLEFTAGQTKTVRFREQPAK